MAKSPFPENFQTVQIVQDTTWTSVGEDLEQSGFTSAVGARSEGAGADVSELSYRLKNSDGKYSPRNPASPLYGKIGRNTRTRAGVKLGAPWLGTYFSGNYAWVPDSAALSITGDIDIRWWGSTPVGTTTTSLIQKWDGVPQRSWQFRADANNKPIIWWSTDGTNQFFLQPQVEIPAFARDIALRVTFRPNNGAGGKTAQFYWAPDLDSEWIPLGGPVVEAGTTSIYDSTAVVRLIHQLFPNKDYGFEIRNGIDGPLVSSMRFDRCVMGWDRGATLLRSNLFYDPAPAGPVGNWFSNATTGTSGVIQDPTHGKVIEARKNSASAAAPPFTLKSFPLLVSTTYKMAFDVMFEGTGSTSNVILYWRPNGTTGQVAVLQNIQTRTSWQHVEVTFTTTATANAGSPAFTPVIPAAYAVGSRVLMRNVVLSQGTPSNMSFFSGDTPNSSSNFYYWTADPFKSASTEYNAVPSATTFSDNQGRYWGLVGANITNEHIIAAGEVAEWPVSWDKKGASTAITDVVASGITRRLGQGEQPVNSPVYNAIMGFDTAAGLQAYWPFEGVFTPNQNLIGQAAGRYAAWYSGTPAPAAYSGFLGSGPIMNIGRGTVIDCKVRKGATTGQASIRHLLSLPADGIGGDRILLTIQFFGIGSNRDLSSVDLWANDAGNLRMVGYNSQEDPVAVFDSGYIGYQANGQDIRLSIDLEQIGADLRATIGRQREGVNADSYSFTAANRPLGPVRAVTVNPTASILMENVAFGHLTVQSAVTSIHDISSNLLEGFNGETAEQRLRRLAAEKGITVRMIGSTGTTPKMGPQEADTWLNIAKSIEAVDGGILHDDPFVQSQIGLRYRTLASLYGQPPAVVIEYQDNMVIPFEPVDDDAMIRNRVARSRLSGSEFVHEEKSGPLGSATVGLYDDSQEFNYGTDDTADRSASWALHVGTWDEGRYPTLGVDLADPRILSDPILVRQLLALEVGERLVIKNPPPWLAPVDVDVLVMGIQTQVTPFHVYLTWTCIPARPYRAAYYNSGHRYSAEGTVTSSSLTTTATSVPLTVPAGLSWTHADGDYDIVIGGERMTVKNVVGSTMTVVRSVNGVVKTHAAGAAVNLAEPSFYAR